jgi:Flp pilus assembly pilin Flp
MDLISRCASCIAAKVSAFVADLRGVSTVEYALMVVAIVAAVALAAGLLGDAFQDLFEDLSKEMTAGVSTVSKAIT